MCNIRGTKSNCKYSNLHNDFNYVMLWNIVAVTIMFVSIHGLLNASSIYLSSILVSPNDPKSFAHFQSSSLNYNCSKQFVRTFCFTFSQNEMSHAIKKDRYMLL